MTEFAVLLAVYAKEKPEYMRQCFDSIYAQTLAPKEVVLVEDGRLTPALYELVHRLQAEYGNLRVVSYDVNRGLGYALNEGLRHCTCDLVARMDTDDISKSERFRLQVQYMEQHPEVAVVGSWIDEFIDRPSNVKSTRKVPEQNEEIKRFARSRNPVNHPSCMLRKSAVEAVGGYRTQPYFEDYDLWVRLLLAGYRLHNLQQSLLCFRQSEQMFNRRGGLKYSCAEIRFQLHIRRMGFISLGRAVSNVCIRFGLRLVPNAAKRVIYLKFLRN